MRRWLGTMKGIFLVGMLVCPALASAQTGGPVANPVVMVIVLGALALAPFIVIMLTSFVKISVVLSILRNALGYAAGAAEPDHHRAGLRAHHLHHGPGGAADVRHGRVGREYERHLFRGERQKHFRCQ